MANFCTNCGSKLEDNYNYCINCGTKIDKSDINPHNPSSNQYSDAMEKKKAKKELKRVVGGSLIYNKTFGGELLENGLDIVITGKAIRQQVEKEIDSGQIKSGGVEFRVNQLILEYKIKKEEEEKKLEMIDEIFESEEITSQIRNSKIEQVYIISIKDSLKDKIINKKENMSEGEIRYYVKNELIKSKEMEKAKIAREKMEKVKIAREKEMGSKEIEGNERTRGGYCDLSCRHCREELLDSRGGIVGDYVDGGMFEYYCLLGHPISYGKFCEYYE